jgi:hypothetical protein
VTPNIASSAEKCRLKALSRRCARTGAESYIVKPVGFQNFSEVNPHLRLEWALRKTARGVREREAHASKTR